MGTLIKMKAEVVNPELPVLTEQGILPYYTGVYVNRLAEKGVTLNQTEINAVTAFINILIEADLIDKIGTFYPFMGNVNVPLLGNRELEFANVTSANTNLDFINNKLRGIKSFEQMANVKLSELENTGFGVMFGGSMISKLPEEVANDVLIHFWDKQSTHSNIPGIQYRVGNESTNYKFAIMDFYDLENSNGMNFFPVLEKSEDLHNFSFTHGLTNVAPPYSIGFKAYNKTVNRNGVNIANAVGSDATGYIQSEDFGDYILHSTVQRHDSIITTLAFFNEILSTTESKIFVDALDTFTAAVGKTVTVG